MAPTPRGPLRGIRRVEDAGALWYITLTCGHAVKRPKALGRPNVYSRCHCTGCRAASA